MKGERRNRLQQRLSEAAYRHTKRPRAHSTFRQVSNEQQTKRPPRLGPRALVQKQRSAAVYARQLVIGRGTAAVPFKGPYEFLMPNGKRKKETQLAQSRILIRNRPRIGRLRV